MCEHKQIQEHQQEHSYDGHHHHSDHEEREIDGICVSHHGEARIFTMEKDFLISYQETLQWVREKMEELSAWVSRKGGLVGHIKGYVTDDPRSAMVSVAGNGCNITESTVPAVRLELTCIVFLVDEEEMCGKIREVFEKKR